MSTKQEPKRRSEQELQESRSLEAVIRAHVMEDLGQPASLLHVQVRLLWGSNYRVNIFVGPDVASAKVAHSFFLAVDGEGKILASNPAIARRY